MLIVGLAALPLAALVDFELTYTVPKRTTADTGVDSFTPRARGLCVEARQSNFGRAGAVGDAAHRHGTCAPPMPSRATRRRVRA